jgi:hypothetical protein
MSYNPYAAPSAEAHGPDAPLYGGGGPQPWEVGEVLSEAWDRFKLNWALLAFTLLATQALAGLPGQLPGILVAAKVLDPQHDPIPYLSVVGVCAFIGFVIGSYLQCGLIRIWLGVARGESPNFGEILNGGSRFLPMLGVQLLVTIAVTLGLVLIVPGVILALGLMLSQIFVVDQEMGPVEAMTASWDATRGHKGKLFLYATVSFFVVLAGAVACCFGIFAAVPTVWVGTSIIYLRLTGRGPSTAAPPPWAPAPPQGPYAGSPYGGPNYP